MSDTHKDYFVEVWYEGKLWQECPLPGYTEEFLQYALEEIRAEFPGAETRVFTCSFDIAGGTLTMSNKKEM